MRATLAFLEMLTLRPRELTAHDARAVLKAGVSGAALMDAIAVAAILNTTTRYADALGFAIPNDHEFRRGADMLLKRGYRA